MAIDTSHKNNTTNNSTHFPIVAIGASAGGVEAITELFQHLSADTGMAFVYIQHLDPNYHSRLTEILERVTKMPVMEATDGIAVEPNHIYIIPPNTVMTIRDNRLTLGPRKQMPGMHMPIDVFFSSLAEHHHEGAIGVILSGTANDGTIGLKTIKMAGGLTFAQDDTAQFKSMPSSAAAEGVVDMVLSPKGIASELEQIATRKDVIMQVLENATETVIQDSDEDLNNIIHLLKKTSGVDFSHYKMNTIKRRIIRRMLLYKKETMADYSTFLRQNSNEITALFQDLLINVTSFFRDPETMEYLKKTILPRLLNNKSGNEPLRIWVPACSTGEEAYSLAITVMELLEENASTTRLQIFATDLSELTIAKARLGVYSRNDVVNISPERLQKYFSKIEGSYRIIKPIRDLCVFATHNIFKDPPFSRIDLLSCCNLMIYLDTVLQKKILSTFHYALNPDGMLVLGKSETIGAFTQLFSQVEKKFKVYLKKRDASAAAAFEMNYRLPDVDRTVGGDFKKNPHKGADRSNDLEDLVDSILLNKYIPATVVVNEEMEILQFRGSTGLYLEPAPGKASLNLLKMAKPGLAFELRNTVHKATKSGSSVKKTGLEVNTNGKTYLISIEVVPLKSEMDEKLYMIVFEQLTAPEFTELKASLSKDKLVKQLEDELRSLKEDMRSIVEEQEASNEELQSANEEIVSSNEELQSINEELETSKEELESTNEELMTINSELQMRNEQLSESYEYAEAVFETIREAIIVLDKDHRIKAANKIFYRNFKLNEADTEGVLLFELKYRMWDMPELRKLLEVHLVKSTSYNNLKIRCNFPGVGPRILLVNGCRVKQKVHNQEVILLAIEDISDLKEKIADDLPQKTK
jgi:two-component system, chemotaxis family, CheB/CheR fusion protein